MLMTTSALTARVKQFENKYKYQFENQLMKCQQETITSL